MTEWRKAINALVGACLLAGLLLAGTGVAGAYQSISQCVVSPSLGGKHSTGVFGCAASITAVWEDLIDSAWDLAASVDLDRIDQKSTNDLTDASGVLHAAHPNTQVLRALDGTGDYFSVADPFTTGDIDIAYGCWVDPDDLTADQGVITKDDGTQREMALFYDDDAGGDTWAFQMWDGSGGSIGIENSASAPTGDLQLVIGQHDVVGNTVELSVDGGAFTTQATSGAAVDTDDPLEVGRMAANAANELTGSVGYCFTINTLLTDANAATINNNGRPLPMRNMSAAGFTIVAGWDGNEHSGNMLAFIGTDLTANGDPTHKSGTAPRAYLAADFDDNDRLTEADAAALSLCNAQDCTVAAWVRDAAGTADNVILGKGTDPTGTTTVEWALVLDSLVPEFVVGDGTNPIGKATHGTTMVANEWGLIVGRHDDGTDVSINLNGGTEVASAYTTGSQDTSAIMGVGGISDTYDIVSGQVAVIYGWGARLLTDAEEDQLTNGGVAYSCESLPYNLRASLVFCATLNDDGTWAFSSIGTHTGNLSEVATVESAEGIADIPGGLTLQGALFAGGTSNEALSHADIAALDTPATDNTRIAVYRNDDTVGIAAQIAGKNGGGTFANEWRMYLTGNEIQCTYWHSGGSGTSTTAGDGQQDGVWQTSACVFDGDGDTLMACSTSHNTADMCQTAAAFGTNDPATDNGSLGIGATAAGAAEWAGVLSLYARVPIAITEAQFAMLDAKGGDLTCPDLETILGTGASHCTDFSEHPSDGVTWDIDTSSTLSNLTDNNTVLQAVGPIRGNTGHAADFTWTTNALVWADGASNTWDEAGGKFEIVAVFYNDSTGTGTNAIISKGRSNVATQLEWAFEYNATLSNDSVDCWVSDGTSKQSANSGVGTLPEDAWSVAFCYYDGTNVGVRIGTQAEVEAAFAGPVETGEARDVDIGNSDSGYDLIGKVALIHAIKGDTLTTTQRDCIVTEITDTANTNGVGTIASLVAGTCDS